MLIVQNLAVISPEMPGKERPGILFDLRISKKQYQTNKLILPEHPYIQDAFQIELQQRDIAGQFLGCVPVHN